MLHPGNPRSVGNRPGNDAVRMLNLPVVTETEEGMQQGEAQRGETGNLFSTLIPWLSSFSTTNGKKDSTDQKVSRYLVAKGLPTLPMRVVERIWNLEFVEMEDMLPSPRTLRLAEQEPSARSLQDSLVGALSQFQAIQQHKAQRRVTDITTWVKCFSLYMAVLAKKEPAMVPSMVAHMHTVLRLHQRATQHLAWLEYDIQFRMELAASADKGWKEGDPWQYVACLPGQRPTGDPFEPSETEIAAPAKTKGKRPLDSEGEKGLKHMPKKPKKAVCRLFNLAPRGCPYGKECIFTHRCTNCGTLEDHGRLSCPTLQGPSSGQKPENREELYLGVPRR